MRSLTIPTPERIILVVEDSPQIRNVIARALMMEGYIAHQAGNGLDGLKMLEKVTPHLILSDVNMPQMDGLQFFQAVRKNPAWTTIPFIFLTSHSSAEAIQRGRELGVEDYLTKPIDPHDLIKIINARLYRTAAVEVAQVGQAYLDTVKVLANVIEGRDHYTRGHVERVTTYAMWVANELNWPLQQLRMLEFGGRLHDIGKILIPASVLNKPGRLTDDEWGMMKRHTIAGAKMLRDIQHLHGTLPYVLYHHEKWDGTGYPKNLRGKEIPVQGRLLALADVYDALTTARPYHTARKHEDVIEILRKDSGIHFDPKLTPIFIDVLNKRRAQSVAQKKT